MSESFKLYRLQQIDSQLDRARARLKEIEAALAENEALRQAKRELEEANQALEACRKVLRKTEADVKDQSIKIEQTEAALYGGKVRNPKELQDLQNEAAALKRFRSVLEDRQLEAMLALETAEEQYQNATAALETVMAQSARQHSDLTSEQDKLNQEVAHLDQDRQAAQQAIPEDEMSLYEKLRLQRRGIAVAKVTDRACSACGSVLNAALLHAARSPSQLTRCDTCGRILYGG